MHVRKERSNWQFRDLYTTLEETFSLCYNLHSSPLGLMYSSWNWIKLWLFITISEHWAILLYLLSHNFDYCWYGLGLGNLDFKSIWDFPWLHHLWNMFLKFNPRTSGKYDQTSKILSRFQWMKPNKIYHIKKCPFHVKKSKKDK